MIFTGNNRVLPRSAGFNQKKTFLLVNVSSFNDIENEDIYRELPILSKIIWFYPKSNFYRELPVLTYNCFLQQKKIDFYRELPTVTGNKQVYLLPKQRFLQKITKIYRTLPQTAKNYRLLPIIIKNF